jgi:predicted nucleotidyltransferase
VSAGAFQTAVIKEVVRRVVEAVDPERIILFGSAARGEAGAESDLDLLIVKAGTDPLEAARRIYRHLYGVGASVDVIVVNPEDLTRYGASPGLVLKTALTEGRTLYEARRAAAAG